LAGVLKQAGFRSVEERTIEAPVILPSAADCVRFERESFGALHQMMSGLDAEAQEKTWSEIADALAAYEAADGFAGPCELVVAAGTK
jgi:hypothetical protein